ncbi:TonB-dependent receptor [Candidatus Marinarcus aquaticus]|uniref:TonB-dependent receptor n=1 Tax=Candidatus Marinarcus aquaticus TaxID=2044504 RepID=A0A4Q0XPK2_9BACT|nr:TonB-dependent receptor [Candidatus Marinarcus aquaticus]RXJ57649.1 TonB-dependent receptor [Candidatus Marinarcus aquaticus]
MVDSKSIVLFLATTIILTSNSYAKGSQSLEPVTVTAQKSEEDVQKVPISMDVFDEYKLADSSIDTIEDLGKYTPNLFLFNVGFQGLTSPSIRGLSANLLSFSSPVSMYVDGVPTMSSFGFSEGLLDIERIEVLKGPQGTLYGKNSEAGVINIITKKPDNELRRKVFTKLGTDGKRVFGLNVSGPIIEDTFYAGISYKHDEKDGFIKHETKGRDVNDKETDYGKLNLRYTPTDNLDISFVTSKKESDDGAIDWARAGQDLEGVSVSSNLDGYSRPTTKSFALNIDYDIDETTKIRSITTKRTHKEDAALDNDLSAMNIMHIFRKYKLDTLSQEIRVEKEFVDTKVVSGIYTDKEENQLSLVQKTMMNPTGVNSHPQELNAKTYSFFTNVIYFFNDSFILNTGVRYDKEKKDIKVKESDIALENDWSNISPKLSLQYNIDTSSMMYATVSKGYRSGGFNPYATTKSLETYDEESLISYEIGYKSMFFDNRLKFNTAIYYMDIDDMQVQTMPTPGVVYMVNAASATSQGIELDIEAILCDNLTLYSSLGYNKTTFDQFTDNGNDYSNNYNPFAPKYNFNLGIQYRDERGIYARADFNGYGKTYFDSANEDFQKAYELVNVKVGYEADNYDIYLYSDNLFDTEHHATNYFNGTTTAYREGREIGVQLAYRF